MDTARREVETGREGCAGVRLELPGENSSRDPKRTRADSIAGEEGSRLTAGEREDLRPVRAAVV